MLERLIDYMADHDGVEFMFMKDVAYDFQNKFPRQ